MHIKVEGVEVELVVKLRVDRLTLAEADNLMMALASALEHKQPNSIFDRGYIIPEDALDIEVGAVVRERTDKCKMDQLLLPLPGIPSVALPSKDVGT